MVNIEVRSFGRSLVLAVLLVAWAASACQPPRKSASGAVEGERTEEFHGLTMPPGRVVRALDFDEASELVTVATSESPESGLVLFIEQLGEPDKRTTEEGHWGLYWDDPDGELGPTRLSINDEGPFGFEVSVLTGPAFKASASE